MKPTKPTAITSAALLLALAALSLTACDSGEQAAPAAQPQATAEPLAPKKAEPPAEVEPEPAPAPAETLKPDGEGVVRMTANDQMRFNASRIEVPAGQPIKVELKHVGQLPVSAMGHNFVVLKPGSDPMAFATSAMSAKDTGYIPDAGKDKLVAHTKLLGGGESDTIEFTVPGPGTYPFLCTFPGHVGLMKGELVVL